MSGDVAQLVKYLPLDQWDKTNYFQQTLSLPQCHLVLPRLNQCYRMHSSSNTCNHKYIIHLTLCRKSSWEFHLEFSICHIRASYILNLVQILYSAVVHHLSQSTWVTSHISGKAVITVQYKLHPPVAQNNKQWNSNTRLSGRILPKTNHLFSVIQMKLALTWLKSLEPQISNAKKPYH